jgi:hypothetical protein
MLLLSTLVLCGAARAQDFDHAQVKLFNILHRMPGALARYDYLRHVLPTLSNRDRLVALQLLASAECELGLYNQAVLAFPLQVRAPAGLVLPEATQWRAADAVDVISELAAHRRIVMVNEAHHNAHTRVLVLRLLPRLRALGYDYFAAEALVSSDPDLQQRGYPVRKSGTEYLHEPLYGEIVREAIRLGFTVVPYDEESHVPTQTRDNTQADNLYRKVFAKHPQARLFVLAGYAHIDKGKGRLGNVVPMAARLQALTGFDPLSVDQTLFLEKNAHEPDDYRHLMERFGFKTASVLLARSDAHPWSAQPALYDVNVVLPPAVTTRSLGDKMVLNGEATKNVSDSTRMLLGSLISPDLMHRPDWLTLGGKRKRYPVAASLCHSHLPCVVDARHAGESDDAIAADRYAFIRPDASSELFLHPGSYRLVASNSDGKVLSSRLITIEAPRAPKPRH